MAPAVTPAGVRDGDPAALAGLCAARGPSVVAYCRHVAGDAAAGVAAADAFGRFRATVVTTEDLRELNPEALLIAATRSAAAGHAEPPAGGACAEVPALLAARANRTIMLGDLERLEAHLQSCPACRAPVERFEAAERAYRDPPEPAMDPLVVAQIIAAMAAAAPMPAVTPVTARNGHAREEAPTPPAVTAAAAPESEVDVPTSELGAVDAVPAPPDAAPPEPQPVPAPEPQAVSLPEPPPAPEAPAPPPQPQEAATPEPPPEPAPQPAAPEDPPTVQAPLPAPPATNSRISRRPPRKRQKNSAAGAVGLHRPENEPEQPPPREHRTLRRARSGAAVPAAMGAHLPRVRRPPRESPTAPRLTRARSRRGGRSRRLPVLLPVAVVFAALLVALFVSGVFGGSDPASSPRVDMPAETPPAETAPADVVVVPGADGASADEIEEAKARERERERARRRRQAAATAPERGAVSRPQGAAADPAPVVAPPPPPPAQTPQRRDDGDSGRSREIDPGTGATGSEQIPPPEDTSTVPDLAPPPESATAP